ncbi:hypothetical protein FSP39_019664 [Pinctada imbricata]|uniref:Uncharacterized protein n=1 Tax=Pinctada imbricata TaxID=66713 RepID=A0AA89BUL3_PINIB|nr:hypothetical protein FSP39_019664 [Pinctada imbricata]
MPSKYREILYKLLQVSRRPDTESDSQLTLHWSRRVYHRRGKYSLKNQTDEKALECQRLNPYQRTYFVQVRQWKLLHEILQTGNPLKIQKEIRNFIKTVNMESLHTEEPGREIDISSEFPDGNILKQACDFSMTFCKGQVLSIQVSADADKGVMVPSPQVFNMTRNSKFCLQHTRDPVKFLAKYSTTSTYIDRYNSELHYLSLWKPVMEMEFVTSAVRDHACTINAVPVEFQSKKTGKFSLGVWYCKERDIDFAYLSRKFITMGEIDSEEKEKYCADYLCIRCEIPNGKPPGTYMMSDAMSNRGLVWMAHAKITKLMHIEEERVPNTAALENSTNNKDEEKPKTVKKWQIEFGIHTESPQATDDMLNAERGVRCCVELIQKTESDRRIEAILNALKDATQIAKAIALRRDIPNLDSEHWEAGKTIDLNSGMETLQPSNEYQCAAIRRALMRRFSLIHGPPGTGKTYTAMKLVQLFRTINVQIHGDGKHIIFCGPSNKSVDLVARWMKVKFEGITPHMVRLYGSSLEHCDFPIPGKHFSTTSASKKSIPDPDLKDIAMHHLIRLDGKPNSKEIRQFDRKFQRYMEIMRVREERRKEKEHVKVRNLIEGREIPDHLMTILTSSFMSVFDIDHDDTIEMKEQHKNVFDLLQMRYANLVDKAEDKRIDVKGKQFEKFIEGRMKTFIEELFCEQRDEAKDNLLTEIKTYKDLVADSVHRELQNHHIIFCTTAVATSSRLLGAMKGRVQQLIIDECGMCTEPESLAAIIATRAEQVVLIGDHKQLRPIIICTAAADLGLERSLFERYEHMATMLRYQYRMHPEICCFPSENFYDGRLETKESSKWKTDCPLSMWRKIDIPIAFCHVEGEEEHLTVSTEEGNEMSSSNAKEVEMVLKVFSHMVEKDKVNPVDINVMSQYNAQGYLLKKSLEKRKYEGFNVNTVVGSQGGEWDYVILSTVRSLPKYRIERHPTLGWCKENLGFITDQHQINVALTRARKGLVIIGNKNLLECDQTWKKLIKHYATKGCYVDSSDEKFPRMYRSQKVSKTQKATNPGTKNSSKGVLQIHGNGG